MTPILSGIPAQCGTNPKGGDNSLAPFIGDAVPEGHAPDPSGILAEIERLAV